MIKRHIIIYSLLCENKYQKLYILYNYFQTLHDLIEKVVIFIAP